MRRGAQDRKGQTIILVPIIVFIFSAIAALTVDIGRLFVEEARLQNAADASALAATQVLVGRQAAGVEERVARNAAQAEAQIIGTANAPWSTVRVEFGVRNGGVFTPVGTGTRASAVRVRAIRNEEAPGGKVPLTFGPLLGITSCDAAGAAICEASSQICGVRAGLSPFAVPRERIGAPGTEIVFYPAASSGRGLGACSEQTAPGNWGLLDLNGGSNSTPELRNWILYGYEGEFDLGDEGALWIDGTPGFRSTLESEIEQMIGYQMIMVIYDEVIEQGSNAIYHCVGFLVATITDADLHGNHKYLRCRIDYVTNMHNLILGDGYGSPNIRRVRLVE